MTENGDAPVDPSPADADKTTSSKYTHFKLTDNLIKFCLI